MKNLIDATQEHLIVCDNESCDFDIPNVDNLPSTEIKKYVNVACPKCGDNLCTKDAYLSHINMVNAINWVNKWFSWITFFLPNKSKEIPNV